MWHEDVYELPALAEMEKEITARFETFDEDMGGITAQVQCEKYETQQEVIK